MSTPRMPQRLVQFGSHTLDLDARTLTNSGLTVEIGAFALKILVALIAADGRSVSVEMLQRSIWADPDITPNVVQAQIAALRRALGDDRHYIITVPRRGYRFFARTSRFSGNPVGLVTRSPDRNSATPARAMIPAAGQHRAAVGTPLGEAGRDNAEVSRQLDDADYDQQAEDKTQIELISSIEHSTTRQKGVIGQRWVPKLDTPFVGRHAELSELMALVAEKRFVALTGAPGVGKTRLAIELGRRVGTRFPDGIFFVSLASSVQPMSVADTIADAVGCAADTSLNALERLVAGFIGYSTLLIVDYCDHLLDATKRIFERLLASTTGLHIIATAESRLFVLGEHPVAIPPMPHRIDDNAGNSDSLKLLTARLNTLIGERAEEDALLGLESYRISTNEILEHGNRICSLVGGIPYALELIAAVVLNSTRSSPHISTSLKQVADELGEFMTKVSGRRHLSLPQSRVVYVVLQWSYEQLNPLEQMTLRGLSRFSGPFSEDAAKSVLRYLSEGGAFGVSGESSDGGAAKCVQELVGAGLIEVIEGDGGRRFAFHTAARIFSRALVDSYSNRADRESRRAPDEFRLIADAHMRRVVAEAASFYPTMSTAARVGRDELNDFRLALDWGLREGKTKYVAEILEDSAPLWSALRLESEYLTWIRTAIEEASSNVKSSVGDQMRLRVIYAQTLTTTYDASDEVSQNWEHAHALAVSTANKPYVIRTLLGLIYCAINNANLARGRELLTHYRSITESTPEKLIGDCLEGILHAHSGKFIDAIPFLSAATSIGNTLEEKERTRLARLEIVKRGMSLHDLASAALEWCLGLRALQRCLSQEQVA
jgi:predicted ATPase/DNA-binding winged helix-turn-helix (wHTH) protein